ncbi:cytochrome P450 [Dendryphion nanum]|uniref:Cytochrome P450 n=1 Tax=Dendryphion nanum TaxID=256645 RepID=A0A9P9IPI8_9PLEO|nr:cytochrome P450 [Dendryphion nanum]
MTAFLDTEYILYLFQDPAEPPIIPHPYLPFLGHVIGLFYYGSSYWDRVNTGYDYPIFTLQTLNARTVGIVDTTVTGVVHKHHPGRSFYGMIMEVTCRLVGFKDESMTVIRHNLDNVNGSGEGLMLESHAMVSSVLSPGPVLNQLTSTLVDQFAQFFNGFENEWVGSLMNFVKDAFTQANAYTIYGAKNHFALHPELVEQFWTYEEGMISVMAITTTSSLVPSNLLGWIFARKAWQARKVINAALAKYVAQGHYKHASPLIQKRVPINLKHGLTTEEAGKAELILFFGILGNAVPSAFWVLANIFARPDLLQKIREETEKVVDMQKNKDGKVVKTLDVTRLKTECPWIVSVYRETLRTIGNLSSVRFVRETHEVSVPVKGNDKETKRWIVKAGSNIQIASAVIHRLKDVWGYDADYFKPERFMENTVAIEEREMKNTATGNHSKGGADEKVRGDTFTALPLPLLVPSVAFRTFGGGSVICPGRHFALTEILAFIALCVLNCDIEDGTLEGETMKLPVPDETRIPLSVMKPVEEPWVRIKRREGNEHGSVLWKTEL